MAAWYVYSAAAGTASGANWANAKTTIAAAITAGAAGDTYYIAHDHAETLASAMTNTFKGTSALPDRALCVNRAGSVPPIDADLRATASVTTTGNSNLTNGGNAYIYGVIFNCGTGANGVILTPANTNASITYEACALNVVATTASNNTRFNNNSLCTLINTTVSFGATGMPLLVTGQMIWKNTASAVTGATLPTTLFNTGSNGVLYVDGVDLSALGSGKTLFGSAQTLQGAKLVNCKLGASVTVAATPASVPAAPLQLINCSTTTNVERNEIYAYQGTLTTETTIIRTSGASDGTTAYSWKIVTTANSNRLFPFETFEGAIWNTATGSSKTLTVSIVTDNITLTDAEAWIEVQYLGSSATPITTLITDANATVLTTAASQTTSTETWTTTGLTTPVKQKLEVTFTPQMVGPVRWRVRVAKASTTVYVCPKADLT